MDETSKTERMPFYGLGATREDLKSHRKRVKGFRKKSKSGKRFLKGKVKVFP